MLLCIIGALAGIAFIAIAWSLATAALLVLGAIIYTLGLGGPLAVRCAPAVTKHETPLVAAGPNSTIELKHFGADLTVEQQLEIGDVIHSPPPGTDPLTRGGGA